MLNREVWKIMWAIMFVSYSWASISIQHWGTIDRGAVGAEGVGRGEGVSPSPLGDGSGVPPP